MRPEQSDLSPNPLRTGPTPRYSLYLTLLTVTVVLLLALAGCGNEPSDAEFNGTVLKNTDRAPAVSLTNQLDQPVKLESLQGRVVVLTFLYTYCPDVCPIVTTQLRDVQTQLAADDASEVEFVAISVDPERDTVKTAREYLDRWELKDEWQFLVGNQETLAPIWQSYYVDPYAESPKEETPTPEPRGAVDSLSAAIAERYLVIHSAPVFLIDREGRRRVVFTSPLDPSEIVQDIRVLLR